MIATYIFPPPLLKKMIGNKIKIMTWLMSLPDDAIIVAKIYKPKRSKQQNNYYWTLVTEIANVLRKSKTVIHNLTLRDYGQPLTINGERPFVFIPDTEQAETEVLKAETYHLKPTSHVRDGKEGTDYRAYTPILGSSQYNTVEMSILLDGCIQEAKAIGIETLPPEELKRMREEEKQLEERKKRDSTGV